MRTMLLLLSTQLARCAPERALCAFISRAPLMLGHCNLPLAGILAGTLDPMLPHAVQDDHPPSSDALQVFDGVDVVDGAVSAAGADADADGADADGAVEAKDGLEDGLVDGMEDGNGVGDDIFADIEGLTKK
eukprot:1263337-Pleurochrysis_carterae.AAC.1